MGRKGPRLINFLEEGLRSVKYRNLKYEGISKSVFSIYFPHKTKLLSPADEQIFNDWYTFNQKKYVSKKDYSNARQAMSSSLRKSDYVEKMCVNGNKLVYRILNDEEVVEKKKQKDELKKMKKEESDYGSDLSSVDSPKSSGVGSPGSSGVGSPGSSGVDSPGNSGVDSPGSNGVGYPDNRIDSTFDSLDIESSSKLIQVNSHDHVFGFPYQMKSVLKENLLSDKFIPMPVSDPMDFVEEPMHVDNTVDVNLSEPQNPIIRNGSVTLDTVDYTRTGDNIPTQEILSEQEFQNFEDISYRNHSTENFLSTDGSLPAFDDVYPLDFNEEMNGSDLDKLELPPLTSMEWPPLTSMESPPLTSMESPPLTSMESPPLTSMESPPPTNPVVPSSDKTAMGTVIKPLPCRYDCDHEYAIAVSSETQSGESTSVEVLVQVDEGIFTPDDPLNEILPLTQENKIQQPTRETLCSTPLITETPTPQMRKSTKRKPNASVKTAEALTEAANARKIAVERETQQTERCREEELYRKREHCLKMKVQHAELEFYELLIKKIKLDLEKEK